MISGRHECDHWYDDDRQGQLHEPEKVNGCLGKINVSSMHLLRLINEVLDMSKIESGKVDLVLEDVSLPDVVDNIVSICRPMMVENSRSSRSISLMYAMSM